MKKPSLYYYYTILIIMIIIVAWWDQITVSKETMLTAIPLTEKKLNLFVKLVTPKIEFHQILRQKANRNSVVSPIKPNQRYIAISNKWRYNNKEKRIIFQRGLLDWLLPIWTLPCVCEICDKMQVVYKELTCDMGELHGNSLSDAFSSMWIFSVGLDNAGGICDEMKLKLYFKPTWTINITLNFKHIRWQSACRSSFSEGFYTSVPS